MAPAKNAAPAPEIASATPDMASQPRGWRFWAIMTSMAVASLLAGLDATAVSTAMLSIIKDFGTSGHIFGRRVLTLFAISIFAIGSAIAGPAPTLGALVAGRAIQGIGCAGINTMVEMVVCDLVPLRERGKFMGFIFAIYAISTTIGPLIGGAFSTYVTWRWIFYLNLPLAGITLAMVIISLGALPKGSSMSLSSLKRVDFAGNTLLVSAITSILLALTWGGGEEPWSSWRTILPLSLGLAGLPLFLLFETRVPEPTTPFRLFSNRTSLAGFCCCLYALYNNKGRIMTKLGRYRPLLMVGFALFPIAIGLFTRLNQSSTTGYWAGIQVIGALAIGIITPVTLPTILTPLAESDVAVATATWAFMRGFGTIWGAAIPLAVFNSRSNSLVAAHLHDNETARALLANGGAYTLAAGGSLYSVLGLDDNPSLEATVKGIYINSLKLCWQVGLAFALLGFLLTFLVKE
ncbi:Efflux pump, partial [Lachnellula willkommii]